MKSKTPLMLIALCLITVFSVVAKENPATSGKAPKASITSLEHNFGTVKTGTPLSFTFKVKNTGDADLEIKNVAPSCGCTSSQFDKLIQTGKEGGITLEVKNTEGYKGEVVKNATVTTNDPNQPTFTLVLRATFTE
ncbi:MAG: DUF1573 domain-containing protein [Acidobacteriota bacterium]